MSREPNLRLRDVIAATGWTYEALARSICRIAAENGEVLRTNKSAVAHWVDGTRPAERTAGYLVEALARRAGCPVTLTEIGLIGADGPTTVGSDPADTATVLGRADVEHRNFLAAAAFTVADTAMPLGYDHEPVTSLLRARTGSAMVGADEIEVIRRITAVFGAADEVLGGGHGLTTVAAYLADTAAPMLRGRFASEAIRRRAFGAVAELAYLAGWKHHDVGHEGAAQRYYQVGFQLACEADPHAHAGWMMRTVAHQALSLKQPRYCIDLVEAAIVRSRGYADGGTEALLHITHARAFAAVQEKALAAKALLAAEAALGRADGPQPTYSQISGPAAGTVASHTARTLTEMGDHRGTERQHRVALLSWDPEKYKRVHMLTYADLGDCLAAQRRADEAVATWGKALDLAEGMASARGTEAISSIRPTLAIYRRRGVPGAAALERRTRAARG
ncbi:Tat pathway signal protein [Longispora fulva]|uniref:Tetratricopeptide repeat protein n=1 Tax=Longispora fulva TaxID=619741 RepID=A0A8J7KPI4_9ACTN|nr:hypothetical protein [Longispora fulva]MBG6136332.1 hypothetical protein [Longispora fulva]GIG63159.1 Tat pathway signal protein [Longispora fulva]